MALTKKSDLKVKGVKNFKLSTAIALVTTVLVMISTLGIAIYALFFIHNVAITGDFYSQINVFQHSLAVLVVDFLVFGLIASYFLTKVIITPLLDLIKGSEKISKGDFEHRLKKTKYDEINKLINTYNSMAENLEVLYKDLDRKVQERTRDLETANLELRNTQAMMVHSEKMRSLGQLVAGITHEINNPINFIHGNIPHLRNYTKTLMQIIDMYESVEDNLTPENRQKLQDMRKSLEYDFIKEDLPMLIDSCQEGTERTKNIILDLKNFSRLEEVVVTSIDLPKEIDTTLNILHNKMKSNVQIIKEYEPNLPNVEGYGGQLNQVFMNILDNACYAIGKNHSDKGIIKIKIQKSENNVIIEFEDNGCGMNKEQQSVIFEPFFTTKPVGEGTGLGMSISYKVIQNHNGIITVESQEGVGTKFIISLPVKMKVK